MIFAQFAFTPDIDQGWKFIGRDWSDPSHTFTAAHDLFEHAPDDTGTMEQEMMALGTAMWMRTTITKGSMFRKHWEIICGDIFGAVFKMQNVDKDRSINLQDCPYSVTLPAALEDQFAELLTGYVRHWATCPQDLVERAVMWARYGCSKAMERWRDCPAPQDLFDKVLKAMNYINSRKLESGTYTIAIDPKTGTFDEEFRPDGKIKSDPLSFIFKMFS